MVPPNSMMSLMRQRVVNAPWWALSLCTGVLFGLAFGIVSALFMRPADGVPAFGVTVGVIGGILFGLVMGPVLARLNGRARDALGELPAGRHSEVLRAASRGPVPADPEIRTAAARLAEVQLAQTLRYRTLGLIVFPVLLVLQAVLAVAVSAWFGLGVVLFGALLALQVVEPRRLRRRVEILKREPAST